MPPEKWKNVAVRRDLLEQAREAFAKASDGRAPTADAQVVMAALSCLIAQCEGRLIPTKAAEDMGRRRVVAAVGQLVPRLAPQYSLKGIAFSEDSPLAVVDLAEGEEPHQVEMFLGDPAVAGRNN